MININDFSYMQRGLTQKIVTKKDLHLFQPLVKKNEQFNHALLLLHGFSSMPAVYRILLPQLTKYDAIFSPILPGHASNLKDFTDTKANLWLQFAEDNFRQLQNKYYNIDVLGLSLGGLLACYLAQKCKVRHLYLLAPALDLPFPLNTILKLISILHYLGFQEIPSFAGNLYTNHHCEIAYNKIPLAVLIELLTLIQNFSLQIPACPTDIFLGYHDTVVDSNKIAKRFEKYANITIHWLMNSAHVIPLDGDLPQLIQILQK